MRIITIEEHIPGAPIAAAVKTASAKDVPYMGSAPGKGLPYIPDGSLFDICEKRVADIDSEAESDA